MLNEKDAKNARIGNPLSKIYVGTGEKLLKNEGKTKFICSFPSERNFGKAKVTKK